MSDTRHHPPVPASRPAVTPDAEEAPTGVIGRITGGWPEGDSLQPVKQAPDSPDSPPGSHEKSATGGTQEPSDRLPVRDAGQPGASPTTGPASGAGPDAAAQVQSVKQPLPVRQPRRPGAAAPGKPPEQSPTPQGFDYFTASSQHADPQTPPAQADPRTPTAHGQADLPTRTAREQADVRAASRQWADAQSTDAQGTDAQRTDAKSTDAKSTDAQSTDAENTGPRAFPAPARPPAGLPAPQVAFQEAPVQNVQAPQWPETADDASPAGPWDPWRRHERAAGAQQDLDRTDTTDRPADGPLPLPAWAKAPPQALPGTDPFGPAAKQGRLAVPPGWDEPEEQVEPAPRAKPPREPYLDNVKFVLIALVVTGHSLVPTLAAHSARAAYLFIYVFHMPLFVIISGYLSRNFWNSNAKTNKLVDTFLMPYVIVEVGYAALRVALGQKWSITIIDPAWLNWYLLALLFWRLSTPVWKRMRYPLVIAVIVYLFSGLSELPGDFSMDRFFGLMPFFVLGLVIRPGLFDFLKRGWVRALSVLVLVGAAVAAVYLVETYSIKLGPIYYKNSYNDLHLVWWKGMALRVVLLAAALAMSAAVMSLVPRRETWFSDLGTRTLYCYLLHGVPVLIAKEMGWLDFAWLYGPLGVAAIMSACFALAIVLCMPITRTVFKWLLEPRLTWLYRRPRTQVE